MKGTSSTGYSGKDNAALSGVISCFYNRMFSVGSIYGILVVADLVCPRGAPHDLLIKVLDGPHDIAQFQ